MAASKLTLMRLSRPAECFRSAVRLTRPTGQSLAAQKQFPGSNLRVGGRPQAGTLGSTRISPGCAPIARLCYSSNCQPSGTSVICNHRTSGGRGRRRLPAHLLRRSTPVPASSRSRLIDRFASFWIQIDGLIGHEWYRILQEPLECFRSAAVSPGWPVLESNKPRFRIPWRVTLRRRRNFGI